MTERRELCRSSASACAGGVGITLSPPRRAAAIRVRLLAGSRPPSAVTAACLVRGMFVGPAQVICWSGVTHVAAGRPGTSPQHALTDFWEKPDVSACREVHMKNRGRARGGIARSRLMGWPDQTLLASTGIPQGLTAIQPCPARAGRPRPDRAQPPAWRVILGLELPSPVTPRGRPGAAARQAERLIVATPSRDPSAAPARTPVILAQFCQRPTMGW